MLSKQVVGTIIIHCLTIISTSSMICSEVIELRSELIDALSPQDTRRLELLAR